jgi:hypothetical protein
MLAPDITKLNEEQMKEMSELYNQSFKDLYPWGKKSMKDKEDVELLVHFDHLHQATTWKIVYQSIEQSWLILIINMVYITMDLLSSDRKITVVPIKTQSIGPNRLMEFYKEKPNHSTITCITHFFIIRGQHRVEAYRQLVNDGTFKEADKHAPNSFLIIHVFTTLENYKRLVTLSRVLNQDLVGLQKE